MSHQILPADNQGVSVHTGFPNPALDASLDALDLNRLLIKHPAGTYFMRISGNDWADQGVLNGDVAIVDRILNPRANDLIIWWCGESFVVGPRHKLPLDVPHWGVVTAIIHQYTFREGAHE
jgi:Peptidase S24-like